MILGLYSFLMAVSLALVVLGFIRKKESFYAFIGLSLFFILSLIILNGNLEVESGADITTTYGYNGSIVIDTTQEVIYSHNYWDDGSNQTIGYWMAVLSFLGAIFLLYDIKGEKYE